MSAYDRCGGGCGPMSCGSRCCAPKCCACPRICGPLRCSPMPCHPMCCTPSPCCPPDFNSRADCTPGMVVRPIRYACCPPPLRHPDSYCNKDASGSNSCGSGSSNSCSNSAACCGFGPVGVCETPVCVQYGTYTCCPVPVNSNSC